MLGGWINTLLGKQPGKRAAQPGRIAIFGNCQTKPIHHVLGRWFAAEGRGAEEVVFCKPVNQCRPEDQAEIDAHLAAAEILITQPIATAGVFNTDAIRERHPHLKLVRIPVLYFAGYHPTAAYIKKDGVTFRDGPVDYNDLIFLYGFATGTSLDRVIEVFDDPDFFDRDFLLEYAQVSIGHLRHRELSTEVKILYMFEEIWRDSLLFFSFNHCRMLLIEQLVKNIADYLAEAGYMEPLETALPDDPSGIERLGRERLPIPASVSKIVRTPIDRQIVFHGETWTLPDYGERFFAFYREHPELIRENTARLCGDYRYQPLVPYLRSAFGELGEI